MRIGIQTWGSYGDVRPFLALADRLQSAGHQSSLSVMEVASQIDYESWVSKSGFALNVVESKIIGNRDQFEENQRLYLRGKHPVVKIRSVLSELILPDVEDMYEASERLCQENDLVVGSYFHYPLEIAAEKTETPFISVALAHNVFPRQDRPPFGFPNLGNWGNPSLWRWAQGMLNYTVKPHVNRLRVQQGLAPIRKMSFGDDRRCGLNLIAVSPQMCEPQACWSQNVYVCGFFDMPNSVSEGGIDSGLEHFLNNGHPPVYMGFGSMTSVLPVVKQKTVQLFSEASRLAGCRAIIQVPDCEDGSMASSEDIFFLSSAPHHLVFPRCGAIVHHGGAGTTQTATLAGRPSVVVAHADEQKFWGMELQRLGIAANLLTIRDVTPEKLARRIRTVIETKAMRLKAESIAQKMKLEDGVAEAVKLIEQNLGPNANKATPQTNFRI